MKYGQFLAARRQSGAKHVYLLAGEEPYYIRKSEQALLRTLVPEESERAETVRSFDGDPAPDDLIGLIDTIPFFADKTVLVVRGTKLFNEKKSTTEKETKVRGKKKDFIEET